MEHSEMYESLKTKYEMNFVSIDTLKGWVKVNKVKPTKGITAEEFKEITGVDYAS